MPFGRPMAGELVSTRTRTFPWRVAAFRRRHWNGRYTVECARHL